MENQVQKTVEVHLRRQSQVNHCFESNKRTNAVAAFRVAHRLPNLQASLRLNNTTSGVLELPTGVGVEVGSPSVAQTNVIAWLMDCHSNV